MQQPETFRVSEETVTLARACRKPLPEEELPMLDLSSMRTPAPDEGFNIAIAREAIGERLLHLVGTIARWEATINPTSQCVVITPPRENQSPFIEQVQKNLAKNLGLDPNHPQFQTFLRKLHEDLRSWLPNNPMGLTEGPNGSLLCTCPDLSPVLPPLDPLEEEEKTP